MDLLTHKCVVLLVLVCVRLGVCLCPLAICRSNTKPWADFALALGFSLASGVLLATVFLHMMTEVRVMMDHFLPDHSLPITELLVTAGFLLTFLLDEIIINLRSSSKVSPSKDADSDADEEGDVSRPSTASSAETFHTVPRGVLMSLHGLGQGMAVGLADTVASTWLMAAAVGVAGSVDSAAASVKLLHCQQSSKVVVTFGVLVTFVMATGIVMGTLLWYLEAEGAVLVVLRGLAAGNLLYQTVYELLTREVRERAMGLLSLFVCLMGFLIILLLQLMDIKSLEGRYSSMKNRPTLEPSTQEPVEEPDYEGEYPDDNNN